MTVFEERYGFKIKIAGLKEKGVVIRKMGEEFRETEGFIREERV